MDNEQFVEYLNKLNACSDAIEWVTKHGGTAVECWRDCECGDWMAWLAAKTPSITLRQLVGALADCAALSLKHYEVCYPHDNRVRDCIDACLRYARGDATLDELNTAADAAYAAARAARKNTLIKCADIFRAHFPDMLGE